MNTEDKQKAMLADALSAYIKDKRTQEECIGFIDGYNAALTKLKLLLSDLEYWKQRCELAEKCLEESPCDPDITSDQIKAHNAYNKFISNFGNDR